MATNFELLTPALDGLLMGINVGSDYATLEFAIPSGGFYSVCFRGDDRGMLHVVVVKDTDDGVTTPSSPQ